VLLTVGIQVSAFWFVSLWIWLYTDILEDHAT